MMTKDMISSRILKLYILLAGVSFLLLLGIPIISSCAGAMSTDNLFNFLEIAIPIYVGCMLLSIIIASASRYLVWKLYAYRSSYSEI